MSDCKPADLGYEFIRTEYRGKDGEGHRVAIMNYGTHVIVHTKHFTSEKITTQEELQQFLEQHQIKPL